MTRQMLLALTTTAAVAAAGCSPAAAPAPSVEVTEAWCRAAPASAPTGGCYATLRASVDDRLLVVETSAARTAEVHTMSMDGGVMRMRRLDEGLPLPAGERVSLKPGGEHLMLMGPTEPFVAGGAVPLTLRFERAPSVTLEVPVQTAAPAATG